MRGLPAIADFTSWSFRSAWADRQHPRGTRRHSSRTCPFTPARQNRCRLSRDFKRRLVVSSGGVVRTVKTASGRPRGPDRVFLAAWVAEHRAHRLGARRRRARGAEGRRAAAARARRKQLSPDHTPADRPLRSMRRIWTRSADPRRRREAGRRPRPGRATLSIPVPFSWPASPRSRACRSPAASRSASLGLSAPGQPGRCLGLW